MDWITGIQRAVDYVEAHITEPIDYEEAAKRAYSSSFHFQRVFSILCGFTLGHYIRMRRLSLAGNELASSDIRVIDAALKYGYDTPESFSRAFTRFHGVSPLQAKQAGASLKSFSPLSVKLVLHGGTTMNYRIETKDAFQIICRKKQISGNEEMTQEVIAPFWQECISDGTIQALCKYIPANDIFSDCIVGASFGRDAGDPEFPYAIGAHYNGMPVTDAGLTVEEIPAHTYAVFPCVGRMPQAIQALYQQICSEFFPSSEYQPCGGTDFEAYPSADVSDPNYACEIWVAVEKK
ncbi:AraC family transcriptional regulator [Candidatus Soleaferrea massiliensis]|uniref:AraC family transcriptional regulator n=1 Tax=Candidatus Soleaferrea massiliensis TaxID=1470354 RepID=UPI00058DC797|nr:AraC family transcriptional regulator [Candidatus Soleaferrea massiliensis]